MQHVSSWIRRHLFISVCLIVLILVVAGGSIAALLLTRSRAPSCGTLTLHQSNLPSYVLHAEGGSAGEVEQCFVQAYQRCQMMTLNVTWMGVDTGSKSTFTIKRQGMNCQIMQSSQTYGLVNVPHPVTISTCQGLVQGTDVLLIKHCGDEGDIVIPRGESCGVVYHQNAPEVNKQAEDCFIQDYERCYAAELNYEPSGTVGYRFQLDSSCKLTVVASGSNHAFPCERLLQQADGLHFLSCGEKGNILVSPNP